MYTNANEDSDQERMLSFIKKSLPSWNLLSDKSSVEFTRIGGVSNFVYLVYTSISEVIPQKLVCKLFGKNSNDFVNRLEENKRTIELSEQKICPKIYNCNEYMRLEEYIPSRNLTYDEVLDDSVLLKIMHKMALLHNVPISSLAKGASVQDFISLSNPLVIKAFNLSKDLGFTESQLKQYDEMVAYFSKEEVEFLQSSFERLNYKYLRFCHNDLFYNNILLTPENEIILIDYEYSNFNYFSYDLANFLEQSVYEYTSTPPYYSVLNNNYPSNEKLNLYIDRYIKSAIENCEGNIDRKNELEVINVDKVIEDIFICRLHSNFCWMVWSILMHGNPCYGSFDFMDFAYSRFKLYLKAKSL